MVLGMLSHEAALVSSIQDWLFAVSDLSVFVFVYAVFYIQ